VAEEGAAVVDVAAVDVDVVAAVAVVVVDVAVAEVVGVLRTRTSAGVAF
jgi:hypothetical protein